MPTKYLLQIALRIWHEHCFRKIRIVWLWHRCLGLADSSCPI